MFNIIVFSKDRACQLDLFLRGFYKYFGFTIGDNINIIYTYSEEHYRMGYDKVKIKHPNINFEYEGDRKFKDLTESLIDYANPYTVFFVDDIVFKSGFDPSCDEMRVFKETYDIMCLSLRLYSGINYCYTIPCDSPPPYLSSNRIWEWKDLPGDWGYPMSLDGHIFRTPEIMGLIKTIDYTSPNTLEGALACNPLSMPKMICLKNSPVLNNPCNKVQTDNGNTCGDISAEFLNTIFLSGKQLSSENEKYKYNKSPHMEIPIVIEDER